ncbi:MAG TPA: MFS transporter [Candidatus Baltobacteraceae bacterium]|nr:MFS transporter [Candidatus Baltobacteraceae bacterium]
MTALAEPVAHAFLEDEGDRSGLRLLMLAHVFTDLNQGVLPVMIPFLVTQRHLTLAAAATLVLAANLLGSVVQLIFGHLSDRRSTAWVIGAALVVASAGTALIGLAPTLPLMLAGAMLSGFGVAAFHPEASRFSNYFAGRRRASGMSFFTVGGYIGFAIGPVVATPLLLAFGLHGITLLIVPAIVVAVLLVRELPRFNAVRTSAHRAHRERPGSNDWRGFSIMSIMVGLRSTAFLAAVTFMPVFAMRVVHVNPTLQSLTLFTLLVGGALGTMIGGLLGDRLDRRRVISVSLVLTALSAGAIAYTGAAFHLFALLIVLAPLFGISLGISAGVLVVLGQEYLPKSIGIASGVTLGLANTVGGIAAPIFGHIGDRFGLISLFATIAAFAVLALASSLVMPAPARYRKTLRPAGAAHP